MNNWLSSWFGWPAPTLQLDGIQVLLKGSPLTNRQRRRMRRGFYETEERRFLQTFIKPGDRVLELGASLGIVTCFLARAVGPTGRVVAVEADAQLKARFAAQLQLNGLVADWHHGLCCPLWNGLVPPQWAAQGFAGSSNSLSGRAMPAQTSTAVVPWVTAGEICTRANLAPTALMIDIEGSERVWTTHPPGFPASVRTIILELHPRILELRETGQVIRAVLHEGFQVTAVEDNVFAFEKS